jgi:sulfatase modifying factor 1
MIGKLYPWGDSIDSTYANYRYDVNNEVGIVDVGSYEKGKNGYELYDMAGNLEEWCNDRYNGTYYSQVGNGDNPRGPATGGLFVYRGGSWYDGDYTARCASRYRQGPTYRSSRIGFRPVIRK